jgi:hypothetical protein
MFRTLCDRSVAGHREEAFASLLMSLELEHGSRIAIKEVGIAMSDAARA